MISLTIANIIGWMVANWRTVAYAVAGIALVVVIGVTMRSCRSKTVEVPIDKLNKIQTGNVTEVKKEVREIVESSADVVRTVDNRSAITEVNVIERNREVDAKVEAATKKIIEVKTETGNVTQEQLQCILVPADCS